MLAGLIFGFPEWAATSFFMMRVGRNLFAMLFNEQIRNQVSELILPAWKYSRVAFTITILRIETATKTSRSGS
jgi:hypothetical protein